MLRLYCNYGFITKNFPFKISYLNINISAIKLNNINHNNQFKDDDVFASQNLEVINYKNKSVLDADPELNPTDFAPNLRPTFNLAAYINKSETLKQLLKLGVELNKIEKRKGLAQFILKLNFEKDVKDHLKSLHDLGIASRYLGPFITKNPLIFKENIEDLRTRVNYLQSKQFTQDQIAQIIQTNPFWLMFSTARIDQRLGYFQKHFKLNGNEVRSLATKQPRLITYNLDAVRRNTFSIREELGFNNEEIKLLLAKPKLWMISMK